MRPVNLIPPESRGNAARGGGGAYAVLGVLGLLVLGVTLHVLTGNKIAERRATLDTLQTQVQAAQAQADARRPYREFAALAAARVETVRQLGAARFDWQRAFADLSKAIPDNVWLTSLVGTVANGVSVEGGSSGSGSLRSALPDPAIEIVGCTTSHEDVARLISRLRLIEGVQRVALAGSSKSEASSGGGGGDCRNGHAGFPQFNLAIFFAPLPPVPSPPSATTTTASAGSPVSGSETTPPASEGAGSSGDSGGASAQ